MYIVIYIIIYILIPADTCKTDAHEKHPIREKKNIFAIGWRAICLLLPSLPLNIYRRCLGGSHYLSNATCLIRPHVCNVCFVVSSIITI